MEKKQSSVEWLVDKVMDMIHESNHAELSEIYQQAKAMHREEHEETWIDAKIEDKGDDYIGKEMTFEKYYNETFNNEND